MAPIDLALLRPAVLVHRGGSFSAAAEQLRVPRSTVSRMVAQLEESLGVDLFQRTTRRVTTTHEGLAFFERIGPAMAGLETALSDFRERADEPSGVITVTATADVASVVLTEAIARYTARYPYVSVNTIVSNKLIDLVREGVDVALRVPSTSMGRSLVRRKIGAIGFSFYASPAYLARCGIPRSDADLTRHDWVEYRGVRPSQFRALGADVPPPPARAICDDMFFLRDLVRKGVGIGVLPTFLAEGDVTRGLLAQVPSRRRFGLVDVYLVRPARRQVPRRVGSFCELLFELLRQRPLAPA